MGKKTEYAEVPSLYKMTEDQARQALEARGLKLGTVTSQPSDNGEEAGLVIEQEYASGSQLEKGSSVRVILSSGPRPDAPQEEPGNSDDSEKTDGTDPKE